MEKVIATEAAIKVIELLKSKHGNILFQQSAGCCDGTVPMCYQADGFYIGSQNLNIGEIVGVPYYVDKKHYEYMKHMQIIVDAIEGQGASFSLESVEGYAFIAHSRKMG